VWPTGCRYCKLGTRQIPRSHSLLPSRRPGPFLRGIDNISIAGPIQSIAAVEDVVRTKASLNGVAETAGAHTGDPQMGVVLVD
jgi:hypothetical protein